MRAMNLDHRGEAQDHPNGSEFLTGTVLADKQSTPPSRKSLVKLMLHCLRYLHSCWNKIYKAVKNKSPLSLPEHQFSRNQGESENSLDLCDQVALFKPSVLMLTIWLLKYNPISRII